MTSSLYHYLRTDDFSLWFDVDEQGDPVTVGTFSYTQTDLPSSYVTTGTVRAVSAVGAIPEPASWALMIVGVGGIGAGLRRRRAAIA